MSISVCMLVGDNHTAHCGVKDYARRLASELEGLGLHTEVLAPNDWGVKSFLLFSQQLKERKFDILHVQYPSIGNRKSFCPHLVGLMRVAKGAVVTLHEYSSLSTPQRLSTHLFRWTADRVLFTDQAELTKYGRSKAAQQVIPIGSNVPACPPGSSRTPTILYFGQIRPHKGIEQFLELARRGQRVTTALRYVIIGSVPERRTAYYNAVRAAAPEQVEWSIDLPFERIAEVMSTSLAAYLPFPDGASYRRGSLLAALTNGLPTISTVSTATPRDLVEVLLPAGGPGEALAHIERLLSSPAEIEDLSRVARRFSERFSWIGIARQHQLVYQQIASTNVTFGGLH